MTTAQISSLTTEHTSSTGSMGSFVSLLPLVLALHAHGPGMPRQITIDHAAQTVQTGDTARGESLLRPASVEVDIIDLLGSIHKELVDNAFELDPDFRELLYSDRWNLYI